MTSAATLVVSDVDKAPNEESYEVNGDGVITLQREGEPPERREFGDRAFRKLTELLVARTIWTDPPSTNVTLSLSLPKTPESTYGMFFTFYGAPGSASASAAVCNSLHDTWDSLWALPLRGVDSS
jgi:hypothetical protein